MDNKPADTNSIKQELKAIRVYAAALLVGVILFTLVSIGVNQFSGDLMKEKLDGFRSYLLPGITGLALLAMMVARQQYQKRINLIRTGSFDLRGKIGKYREAVVVYMAICDATALFSIILFMLSGDFLLLIVTGAMLLLMAARLYAIKGVAAELELNWQEQQELS